MENTAGATQERKRNAYPSWFFLVSHSFFGFFLCSAYIFSCIGHVHLNVVHHFSLWTCCEVLWGQCRLSAKSYQIQKVPTCTTISRAGLLIVVQMGTYSHSELLKAQRKKCWVFLSDLLLLCSNNSSKTRPTIDLSIINKYCYLKLLDILSLGFSTTCRLWLNCKM